MTKKEKNDSVKLVAEDSEEVVELEGEIVTTQ